MRLEGSAPGRGTGCAGALTGAAHGRGTLHGLQKFKQKQPGPAIGDAVARAVNYETSIADLAARSERRAWWVAATASTLALLLGAGYFKVMPLKERVPFLVMADASSGNATVARLDENFRHRASAQSSDPARTSPLITLRESYDVAMMNLRSGAPCTDVARGRKEYGAPCGHNPSTLSVLWPKPRPPLRS